MSHHDLLCTDIPMYEIDPITNELQTNGLTQPTFAELLMVSHHDLLCTDSVRPN
jgi:hypothetical protein